MELLLHWQWLVAAPLGSRWLGCRSGRRSLERLNPEELSFSDGRRIFCEVEICSVILHGLCVQLFIVVIQDRRKGVWGCIPHWVLLQDIEGEDGSRDGEIGFPYGVKTMTVSQVSKLWHVLMKLGIYQKY